ncbi:MAG: LysE family translocator [Firmicutes bacterium]|nr:LysE family translocator [Bacillota bacterium]MCL5056779.1 LysE family translocator [Actinomycetota bacterium]
MDIAAIFTTAFVVGFSGAMMPGPLLVAAIGESARRGFVAGPLIVLGHALLELSLVILLVLGLVSVLAGDWVKISIGIVGGIFLLYFGWTMSRDALKGRISLNLEGGGAESGSGKGMHPVAAGALLSLSNPLWIMWWATVGLLYITQALEGGALGITSFYSGHILSDVVWYSLVSGAVAGGRRFISQKLYSGVLAVCGLFVTGLGVYFIWDAIKIML